MLVIAFTKGFLYTEMNLAMLGLVDDTWWQVKRTNVLQAARRLEHRAKQVTFAQRAQAYHCTRMVAHFHRTKRCLTTHPLSIIKRTRTLESLPPNAHPSVSTRK